MMRPLALAVLLGLLTGPSLAAPARVLSGEHDGFTRLVVDLGEKAVWQLGRSTDGYELRIEGPKPTYDLTAAFKLIGRTRLAAIWADDASGSLRFGIACACHAVPFEFRPGTIVIDLKDGPPPEDSVYESSLDPISSKDAETAEDRPNALAYAWADQVLKLANKPDKARTGTSTDSDEALALTGNSADPPTNDVTSGDIPVLEPEFLDPELAPLRDELMREISLGAAQGVVDMQLPDQPVETDQIEKEASQVQRNEDVQARVALGGLEGLPQLRFSAPGKPGVAVGAEGADCPTDAQLDLSAWGDDARPVWEQISEARNDLIGEFDHPNAEALRKSVQFYLFIGFGAEARDLLRAYPGLDPDEHLWTSLSHSVDGSEDPAPAFATFGACDGAAAMWALLSTPISEGTSWNIPAVQRSFSALPFSLRQHLGPRLVETLVSVGHEDAVPVVANAIRRAGDGSNRSVQLMEAEVAAKAGEQATADKLLEELIRDPGPESALATVALVEGKARRGVPVEAKVVTELEALAVEYESSPDGQRFLNALILARALSGDFRRAFSEGSDDPGLRSDLWRLLSDLGTDDQILEVATIPPDRPAPAEGMSVAATLAERFLTLGLPAQAALWLSGTSTVEPLLAARVALAQRDGASAMVYLEQVDGEEAKDLRVKALILSGQGSLAAKQLAALGDIDAATSALARARDWDGLKGLGQAEWQAAVRATSSAASDVGPLPGPLAEGAALVEKAQSTRQALSALLAEVPVPERQTN